MVMKVGVIGLSVGNGHPFSFSAIINGYSNEGFKLSGWPVIHKYLKEKSSDEFGIPGVQVTHAWTQSPDITRQLCDACKIANPVEKLEDMVGVVDAIILARDDWKSHYQLAKPFLDIGIPVFIDKPLSLDEDELKYFAPYLEAGMLMSCSGFRFATELDAIHDLGRIKCIHGAVVLDWERYGVHILDAVMAAVAVRPIAISRNISEHQSFSIAMDDGSCLTIDAIGDGPKTFHVGFFGDKQHVQVDLHDNFSAFKKTLQVFCQMCTKRKPEINPEDTILIMRTLMAGTNAKIGGGYVSINDFSTT